MRAPLAALSGLITGLSALAVAELVAAAVRPEAGPVTAVGGAVVDRTPPWLKDFAVRNFGTNDKLVLQLGILALLAVFAMAVGVVAARHRLVGSAAVLVFGVVGAVAAGGGPPAARPPPGPRAGGGPGAAVWGLLWAARRPGVPPPRPG
ncbi:molybdopterin-binding oxidoreductase, partial [Streptomyces sp. NPDC126933]